ncbi:MAG: ABC transporter ATP-binding protein [Haloechinothrix sp.]
MAVAEDLDAVNSDRRPTVIVDQLHVVYRIVTASGGDDKGTAATALQRMVRRQQRPTVREVHAVKGVSFTAYEGDAIGVVGRNGSGKSTLMRAIAGLLPAEQGSVYAQGQPSFLGVNAALMNGLTGERNVELGCLAMGMTREQAKEKHDDIVEFSGVGDFIKLPMRAYSSGMGARLRFAIAAAKSHDVLLVDEALSTGDADFRKKSEQRIREMREEAGTVFLVSHSMKTITRTCDRAIWIDKGVLRMDDDAKTVVKAYLDENS